MVEQEAKDILNESLGNLSETLRNSIINEVLQEHDYSLTDWEQYRILKKKIDIVWREVKRCSERVIVNKRSEALKTALKGLRPR